MSKLHLDPSDIKVLSYLLDGQGRVNITHDRPPHGIWFVDVTDTWTDMITQLFTSPSLSTALMKAAEKKSDIQEDDLDEILGSHTDEIEEIEEEEDE